MRARANTKGSNVEALYRVADNQVEALQFRIERNSRVCGIPLSKLKQNQLINCLYRSWEKLIYPDGNDQLEPHDRVIVVTTQKNFDDIIDILE